MRHNISTRFTKVEIEAKTDIDKTIISLETDNTVEIEINHIKAEENYNRNYRSNYRDRLHETTIHMMIGEHN